MSIWYDWLASVKNNNACKSYIIESNICGQRRENMEEVMDSEKKKQFSKSSMVNVEEKHGYSWIFSYSYQIPF